MNNTKQRNIELGVQAVNLLRAKNTDINEPLPIRELAKELAELTDCHYSTAKRHIALAAMVLAGEECGTSWGGPRPGSGRPPKNEVVE